MLNGTLGRKSVPKHEDQRGYDKRRSYDEDQPKSMALGFGANDPVAWFS
jgi:hypothetical protein